MTTNTFTVSREEVMDLIHVLKHNLKMYHGPITVECKHYELLRAGAISFRRENGTALGIAQSETTPEQDRLLLEIRRAS